MARFNIEKSLKVKKLRNKNKLSYRDIGILMKANVHQIYRWYHYPTKREGVIHR